MGPVVRLGGPMDLLFWLVLLFLVVHPLLGIRRGDWGASLQSMVVADRGVSPLRAAGSLLATILGASAVMGTSGLAYDHGWIAIVWLGAGVVGLLLLAWLLPRVRFADAMTLPHLLGAEGSPLLRRVSAALIVPAWVGIVAAQFSAVLRITTALAPGMEVPLTCLAAVMVALYVVLSGQKGVIRTDSAQLAVIVLFLGFVLGYLLLGDHAPVTARELKPLPFPRVLDVFLLVGFPFLVGPDMFSRVLTVPDLAGRRKTLVLAAVGLAVAALAITAIGVLGRQWVPEGGGERVLLEVPGRVGTWAKALAGLGLLAVVLSSADTCVLSASCILAMDLLGKQSVTAIRVAAAVFTATALAMALWLGGIIPALMWSYTLYTTGLAVPAIAALFLHKRLGTISLLASLTSGAAIGVYGNLTKMPYTLPAALAVSVLAAMIAWKFERRAA